MRRRIRGTALAVALTVFAGLIGAVPAALVASAPAGASTITTGGPLTSVTTSPDLNCAVNHTGDTQGEFYADTACGTFAVVNDTMYSPASIPAGEPGTPWTPVSQDGPTGAGTAADPYRIVTTVAAGETGVRLTQTDTYITGQESYRTDVAVTNAGEASTMVRVYRAGDCYLQDSDFGLGAVDATSGAVACTSATSDRIEQFLPITAGSSYLEAGFSTVWSTITAKAAFPNTCLCTSNIDNGAGLSWDATVAAGATTTISSILTFSPLGIVPLTVTKTADAAETAAGGTNGYTITVNNPNASAVSLSSITDTLPAGFAYVAGSTTGVTTADPAGGPSNLSWTGPLSVAAGGSATLHFGVTVSSTPGTYTNTASATAAGYEVITTGAAATVTVTGTTPVSPLVVTLSPATSTGPVGSAYSAQALLTRDNVPQAGVVVSFAVTSGPNVGTEGQATTDASGLASFGYPSTVAGTDSIQASVVEGETVRTSNTVTRTWTPAATSALTVTSEGEPATVTAGANALRIITVTNTGEGTAPDVSISFTLPAGTTLVRTNPSQGTCGTAVAGVVTCELGDLAAGASANVRFVVGTATAIPPGGTITTSATAASGDGAPTEPAQSTTTIVAPTPGQASGYVPPGGTLSTGTDATAADNTVASFSLPNTGLGAVIAITSVPCAPGVCLGKTMTFTPFTGYDDPANPAHFAITWDKSVAGKGLLTNLYVLKETSTSYQIVPPCESAPSLVRVRQGNHWVWVIRRVIATITAWLLGGHTGYADPSPCVDAKSVLRNGDVRFDTLFLSGDPSMRRR